jgi:N6-L-threonylcarbamoyladenine synthase
VQAAIVEVLVKKSLAALRATGLQRLVVAGGVGANALLREQLNRTCGKSGVRVHYPELHLCTDNGAMIALAAGLRVQAGLVPGLKEGASEVLAPYAFDVRPRWPLSDLTTVGNQTLVA